MQPVGSGVRSACNHLQEATILTFTNATPPLAIALCAGLAACGTPEPIAYSGIASSGYLAPNPQDSTGRIPYRYSAPVEWQRYDRIVIEPVVVYRGSDHQFGELSESDKAALASYMQARFSDELGKRFARTEVAGPKTLRMKLTLTGATANTPVLGTLSRFDIAGGLYNGVQSVRGGEGTLTGAVIYSVEIHDASSGELLTAFVAKQYPNAFNIEASLGALDAAKVGIDKGAEELVAQLR